MKLDLVDHFKLLITPTLLGTGRHYFVGGYERTRLKLVKTQAMDSGAVILRYDRAAEENRA